MPGQLRWESKFLFDQILSHWLFLYRQKKYFHVHGPDRPVVNLPIVDFPSQPEKYHYPGQVHNLVFCFTSSSRKFWATLSLRRTIFFSFFTCHILRYSRQATLDWERSTLCHSFINLIQIIGDIKQHKWKIIVNIIRVFTRIFVLFSGREVHVKHRSFTIIFFSLCLFIKKYIKHRINRNSTF